jgi:hypothetical protein
MWEGAGLTDMFSKRAGAADVAAQVAERAGSNGTNNAEHAKGRRDFVAVVKHRTANG